MLFRYVFIFFIVLNTLLIAQSENDTLIKKPGDIFNYWLDLSEIDEIVSIEAEIYIENNDVLKIDSIIYNNNQIEFVYNENSYIFSINNIDAEISDGIDIWFSCYKGQNIHTSFEFTKLLINDQYVINKKTYVFINDYQEYIRISHINNIYPMPAKPNNTFYMEYLIDKDGDVLFLVANESGQLLSNYRIINQTAGTYTISSEELLWKNVSTMISTLSQGTYYVLMITDYGNHNRNFVIAN